MIEKCCFGLVVTTGEGKNWGEGQRKSDVRTIDSFEKSITYSLGTFIFYHQEQVIKYAEVYLNPLFLITL